MEGKGLLYTEGLICILHMSTMRQHPVKSLAPSPLPYMGMYIVNSRQIYEILLKSR